MKITPEDKCGVCEKSLFNMDESLKECKLCGALICDPCFEESKKERGNICQIVCSSTRNPELPEGRRFDIVAFPTKHRPQDKSDIELIKKSAIERFTFHDLKRKGVSDFSGDKLLASGHHSASMLRIYDVSIGTIPATK